MFLRLLGYTPIDLSEFENYYKYPDGIPYQPDSMCIQTLLSGIYEVVIKDNIHYTVTHSDGQRVCSVIDTDKPLVCFFGCSFTYGTGVNDEDTFVHLYANHNQLSSVLNFGRPGLNTLQSFELLKNAVRKYGAPHKAFFSFSKMHYERNVLSMRYRRLMYIPYLSMQNVKDKGDMGYLYLNKSLEKQHVRISDIYTSLPLSRNSALMWQLTILRDHLIDEFYYNKIKERVSFSILEEVLSFCIEKNIEVVVYDFYANPELETFLLKENNERVSYARLDIDWDNEMTFKPIDSHPSQLGHEAIFENLKLY